MAYLAPKLGLVSFALVCAYVASFSAWLFRLFMLFFVLRGCFASVKRLAG